MTPEQGIALLGFFAAIFLIRSNDSRAHVAGGAAETGADAAVATNA